MELDKIMVFSVPIVAIVCITINSLVKSYLQHETQKSKLSVGPSASMEKRMAELENRILTLQDIVIGGEYETRRRLERATAQHHESTLPPPAESSLSPSQPARSVQNT